MKLNLEKNNKENIKLNLINEDLKEKSNKIYENILKEKEDLQASYEQLNKKYKEDISDFENKINHIK